MVKEHTSWMRSRGYADSYVRYRSTILRALTAFGQPGDIEWKTIERMVLERPVCDATKNLWTIHLGQFYEWAVKYGHVDKNPILMVDRLPVPDNLPRPISERDLQVALANASDVMKLWLLFGAWAGMRCMEIAHLKAEDIGRDIKAIRIVDSKHGGSRVVPMHNRISDALPDQLPPGRLWVITPNIVSQRMSRHFHGLGVNATAHMLRHRFATQVYEQTGDINLVRELLGHRSIATTQVYARLSDPKRRAAVDALA